MNRIIKIGVIFLFFLLEIPLDGQNLSGYEASALGQQVNSTYSEHTPCISPDGKTLYFSRLNHPRNIGGNNLDDIWVSHLQLDNSFSNAINIGLPVNGRGHENAISIHSNTNTLYFSKNNEKTPHEILASQKSGRTWLSPKALDMKILPAHYQVNRIKMSVDRSLMLMAIDTSKTGRDPDLFVSFLLDDGSWSFPKNLGQTVNTSWIERDVFIAADNKTIYFSSTGHSGMGGLDLFKSTRLDYSWTNWSLPENLGPEINSLNDDFGISLPASGELAYFVRQNNYGSSDIFKVLLPFEFRPEAVSLLIGEVEGAINKRQSGDVKVFYSDLQKSALSIPVSIDEDFRFQVVLSDETDVLFHAEMEGFFSESEAIWSSGFSPEELDFDVVNQSSGIEDSNLKKAEIDKMQNKLRKIDKELTGINNQRIEYFEKSIAVIRNKTYPGREDSEVLKTFEKEYFELLQKHNTPSETKGLEGNVEDSTIQMAQEVIPDHIKKQEIKENNAAKEDEELEVMKQKFNTYYKEKEKTEETFRIKGLSEKEESIPLSFEQYVVMVEQELEVQAAIEVRNELRAELMPEMEKRLGVKNKSKTSITWENDMFFQQSIKRSITKKGTLVLDESYKGEAWQNYLKRLERILKVDLKVAMRKELLPLMKTELKLEQEYALKREAEAKIRKELESRYWQQASRNNDTKPVRKLDSLTLSIKKSYNEIYKTIKLRPIEKDQVIFLKNIYFKTNSTALKPESVFELERVRGFLETHPSVVVEFGVHTHGDCSNSFASELTENRAKLLARYMTDKGLPEKQVKFRGYGKMQPITKNNSFENKLQNQRVEMKVLEYSN
ncbi:MAG: OmpA family protein [Bacteroidetes bacterium]|nr:OmpA family protein [Bacteroidota bacterium]